MSLTLSGAIKARIESGGLQLAAYRDLPADFAPLPYAVVLEGIARPLEPTGDNGATTTKLEVREQVQIDVWQALTDVKTKLRTERPSLAAQVAARLHMHTLEDVDGGRVYPLRVVDVRRVPNPDKNLVHDTITLTALRQIGAPS